MGFTQVFLRIYLTIYNNKNFDTYLVFFFKSHYIIIFATSIHGGVSDIIT